MPRYWNWGTTNRSKSSVELGKEYSVSITERSRKGDGIAKLEGITIFVKGGQIGQNCKVRITQIGNRFATAEIVRESKGVDFATQNDSETSSPSQLGLLGNWRRRLKETEDRESLQKEIAELRSNSLPVQPKITYENVDSKSNYLSARNMEPVLPLGWSKILKNKHFSDISPSEFEELIGRLFVAMGYSVENLPDVGDYGSDLVARKGNDTIVIQCKRYAEGNLVGAPEVQQTLGAMWKYKANKSIIVTTSSFTVRAEEQAKEAPIELWDKKILDEMTEKYLMFTIDAFEQDAGYDNAMKEIENLREYLPVDVVDTLKTKFLQGDHKSVRKQLAEIKKGASEKSFKEWATLIRNEACTTCNINEADLTLEGEEIKEGEIHLKFQLENYEQKMPCVVNIIKQNINRMPPLTRLYFEQLLSNIRQKYGIS